MRKTPAYARRSIAHVVEHAPAGGAGAGAAAGHGPHRLALTAALDVGFLTDLLAGVRVADLGPDPADDGDLGGDAGFANGERGGASGSGSGSEVEGEDDDEEGALGAGASGEDETEEGPGGDAMEGVEGAGAAAAGAGLDGAPRVRAGVRRAAEYVRGLLWTLTMYFSGGREWGRRLEGGTGLGPLRLCFNGVWGRVLVLGHGVWAAQGLGGACGRAAAGASLLRSHRTCPRPSPKEVPTFTPPPRPPTQKTAPTTAGPTPTPAPRPPT